jgi:hypothetical protein
VNYGVGELELAAEAFVELSLGIFRNQPEGVRGLKVVREDTAGSCGGEAREEGYEDGSSGLYGRSQQKSGKGDGLRCLSLRLSRATR